MDDKQLTIQRWLIKAERDLVTARTMLDREEPPTDIVCFHAQQCSGRALKAFLVAMERDFPKIHDLTKLLDLCIQDDPSLAALETTAADLADYALEPRYVDEWRDIPRAEAEEAVRKAASVLAQMRQKVAPGRPG